ncbi:MAG: LytTR family DNA-binding domain-containing protein [Mangrovibacterium sp.]|nr:LytTR family DNA-binding domain-containing protein [Mangrovibacterium sp.]
MIYRTVIVDDDKLARRVLLQIFEQNFSEIEVMGEADSVDAGVSLIRSVKPDLVFLDIEMADGTGFDLIDRLEEVNFRLIFTTSYSDYAIKAFKYFAFDYILKPVLPENVKATIHRIKDIPLRNSKNQIEMLKNRIEVKEEKEPTIALPEMDGFTIIKVKNILRCEGERNYSRVFYKDGTSVLISRTLLEFDQLLVPHGFFRIHRSHLINLDCVSRYLKAEGGMVEMTDQSRLRISPKYKEEFLDMLLHNKL